MAKRVLTLIIALTSFFILPNLTPVQAQQGENVEKFRRVEKGNPNNYIVVFKDSAISRLRVAGEARALALAHGGELKFIYEHVLLGFAVRLPEAAAIALSKNLQVEYVEEEAVGSVEQGQTLSPGPNQFYGIDRIDQRDLPLNNLFLGTGNGPGGGRHVYILDTGFPLDCHEFMSFGGAFPCRLVNAHDTFGGFGADVHNHGSKVAGIIGGRNYGVAKSATLHTVKVCNDNGDCFASNAIAGLDWVVANANHQQPAVINMSLILTANTSVDTAARNAMAAGIIVVAAAGNNEVNAENYSPGRVVEIVTVGATLKNDQRAQYSNWGAVDLYAPGGDVAAGQGIPTVNSNGSLADFDGTSAAAPHVAGVAAAYAFNGFSSYVNAGEIKKGSTWNKVTNLPSPGPDNLLYSLFPNPANVSHFGGSVPFYRYYSGVRGDHFYTTNFDELGPTLNGWDFEFVQGYIFPSQLQSTEPLYQYYNPTISDHFYTLSPSTPSGYNFEKIAGYVYSFQASGSLPLYRYYNAQLGDHFYTTDFAELGNGLDGWVFENIECYISP